MRLPLIDRCSPLRIDGERIMRHQCGIMLPSVVLHWLHLWHTGPTHRARAGFRGYSPLGVARDDSRDTCSLPLVTIGAPSPRCAAHRPRLAMAAPRRASVAFPTRVHSASSFAWSYAS